MPRYRRAPLTLAELWVDGPPVRVRDLRAMTGLSAQTILREIVAHELCAQPRGRRPGAAILIERYEVRRWVRQLGCFRVEIEQIERAVSVRG